MLAAEEELFSGPGRAYLRWREGARIMRFQPSSFCVESGRRKEVGGERILPVILASQSSHIIWLPIEDRLGFRRERPSTYVCTCCVHPASVCADVAAPLTPAQPPYLQVGSRIPLSAVALLTPPSSSVSASPLGSLPLPLRGLQRDPVARSPVLAF